MSAEILQVTSFSLAMAAVATLVMLPPGVGLAWVLARRSFWGQHVVETLVTLPLVLPPVATGLILLRVLGRRGPLGRVLDAAGIEIIFTWRAVVVAMAVMGLPLLVRAARSGFEQVDRRYEQIAETLGASPARVFFTISLPLARRGVLAGAVLGFSRALGEFGGNHHDRWRVTRHAHVVCRDLLVHADRSGCCGGRAARGGGRDRVCRGLRLEPVERYELTGHARCPDRSRFSRWRRARSHSRSTSGSRRARWLSLGRPVPERRPCWIRSPACGAQLRERFASAIASCLRPPVAPTCRAGSGVSATCRRT